MNKLAVKMLALASLSLLFAFTSTNAQAAGKGGVCFYNCGVFEGCQSCGVTCGSGSPYCNSGGCGCNSW